MQGAGCFRPPHTLDQLPVFPGATPVTGLHPSLPLQCLNHPISSGCEECGPYGGCRKCREGYALTPNGCKQVRALHGEPGHAG